MNAYLDSQNGYGERLGGENISDPRLQHRLDLLPPHTPPTAEDRALVATRITRAYPVDPDGNPRENLRAREDLLRAFFGSPHEFEGEAAA